MLLLLEITLLAIVQGIGEFLPISSSGHVVVLAALFDQIGTPLPDRLTVNIILHLGTLLAIIVFYRHRIIALVGPDRRLIGLILVGSLPAALFGLGLKLQLEDALESPLLAGLMFPVTGAMLLWTRQKPSGDAICRDLSFRKALWIGCFQALAIFPGISRSGSTIVAGLAAGLHRDEAATFSFLLAIPAIAGAGLVECLHLFGNSAAGSRADLLFTGAMISFLVGLMSLWWLIRWLQRGKLHLFAWWLFVLGPAVLAWQFLAAQ